MKASWMKASHAEAAAGAGVGAAQCRQASAAVVVQALGDSAGRRGVEVAFTLAGGLRALHRLRGLCGCTGALGAPTAAFQKLQVRATAVLRFICRHTANNMHART